MQKFIFIDIDGTLLDHHIGIPHSAVTAIHTARANGHKVFISTGRARADLSYKVIDIGFDGLICASGAHVEVAGKLIDASYIRPENVHYMQNVLAEKNIAYVLESPNGLYCCTEAQQLLASFHDVVSARHPEIADLYVSPARLKHISDFNAEPTDINKISMFAKDPTPLYGMSDHCDNDLKILVYDRPLGGFYNGEVQLKAATKGSGIEKVLRHFNAGKHQTMGYGDSLNDLEMLAFCEIGVAMGDASDALKAIADDITHTAANDGIFASFKKYNVI